MNEVGRGVSRQTRGKEVLMENSSTCRKSSSILKQLYENNDAGVGNYVHTSALSALINALVMVISACYSPRPV